MAPKIKTTENPTLFDNFDEKGFIEEIVSVSSPIISQPEEGAASRLEERLATASHIMDTLNGEARQVGAAKNRSTSDSRFNNYYNKRHIDPEAIYKLMKDNAEYRHGTLKTDIEALVKAEALREAGFSEDEIQSVRRGVMKEINEYRPGIENGSIKRKKKLKKMGAALVKLTS